MRRESMKPQSTRRQLLGKKGEAIAAQFLAKRGYSILERNFKKRYGELDIIALSKTNGLAILVFVEVKTRIGRQFGLPEEAVTPRKLREVVGTAQFYKSLHPELPSAMRIDVVAVEFDECEQLSSIRHIPNVTQ